MLGARVPEEVGVPFPPYVVGFVPEGVLYPFPAEFGARVTEEVGVPFPPYVVGFVPVGVL